MSATATYRFGEYTLRPTFTQDLALAMLWTEGDPFHISNTPPDFWIEQRPGRDSYLLSDLQGPVFFFKLHRKTATAVEVHIQFGPDRTMPERARTAHALIEGMCWLESISRQNGIHELSFDSHNDSLAGFAVRRLGFQKTHDFELVKAV